LELSFREIKHPFIILFFIFFINAVKSNATNIIVDGYMDKISYDPGNVANVFIKATSIFTKQKLYLYTVNNVIVDSVTVKLAPQKISKVYSIAPWKYGYGYVVSFTYTIPHDLKSGMYNWGGKIFFIVKSAAKNADITIIYPSNTEAAYNEAGGKSLYPFNSTDLTKSCQVSFLRPLSFYTINQVKILSDGIMKWLNTLNGYSVQYVCDQDMDDFSEIKNSKIIVVIGHSEYWTREARLNFDRFVNGGKDAIILSGNTMWWQVRYEGANSHLVCIKNGPLDHIEAPLLKTVNWPDVSLNYPVLNSIGVDFIHGALTKLSPHGWYGYKIMLPHSPLLAGTGLNFNDTLSCKSSEYDGTLFSGFNKQGDPILDTTALGFSKIELIGYDWGIRPKDTTQKKGYGTFIAFKKNISSGNVINTGMNNWCALYQAPGWSGGFGGADSGKIKQITLNMFDLLLAHKNIYTTPIYTTPVEIGYLARIEYTIANALEKLEYHILLFLLPNGMGSLFFYPILQWL